MKHTKQQQEANDARARRAIVSAIRGCLAVASGLCGLLLPVAGVLGFVGMLPVLFVAFVFLGMHAVMMGE